MGSGDWFKTIISGKKVRLDRPKQSKGSDKPNGSKNKSQSQKNNANGKATSKSDGAGALPTLTEDAAASRIQTTFRAYMVEWSGGADTMDEILEKIHQREDAAMKRERAMAYAFNHQWKANSNQNQSPYTSELGKANWGWSWKERWIAARPWEIKGPSQSIIPKKVLTNKSTNNAGKISNLNLSTQKSVPSKSAMLHGKTPGKPRRMSYPGTEKKAVRESDTKPQETTLKS